MTINNIFSMTNAIIKLGNYKKLNTDFGKYFYKKDVVLYNGGND